MKAIKIAQRLSPFSHEKGSFFLIPQTSLFVQVFPTRFFCWDLQGSEDSFWVDFKWTGPVKEFTTQVDLQKGTLTVFGKAQEGYVRYHIEVKQKSLVLTLEKAPQEGIEVSSPLFTKRKMYRSESVCLIENRVELGSITNQEVLSLGNHKAQDFSFIKKRLDPVELFPLWLRFADCSAQDSSVAKRQGNYLLLDECYRLIKEHKKQEIIPALLTFFLSAFQGMFVPRLLDLEYQGLAPLEMSVDALPVLPLLHESAACIRSLFYQEIQPGEIAVLPCLPPQLHCGRMINISTLTGQTVHFEWTKKALRSLIVESSCQSELTIHLPKGISSCRFKAKKANVKKIELLKNDPLILSLEPGSKVVVDRFEG